MELNKKSILIIIIIIIAILAVCYFAGVFNSIGIPGTSYGEGSYVVGQDIPAGTYSTDGLVTGGPIEYHGYEQKIIVENGANVEVPEGVTITFEGS